MKRAFDIVCSGFGLLVLAPVGLLLALLVKLSDGGPVFYSQVRIGQFGREFRIWKFRSMKINADKMGAHVTREGDPRITGIGRWMRKSKLDELPQLWNVFTGDMSLVGPRPEVPRYVQAYTPEQRRILDFKPGITDLATLLFRNEEALLGATKDVESFYIRYCLPKKIELNRQYAERAGLVDDLWVILQTICPYWLGVLVLYGVGLSASFLLAYQLHSDFRVSDRDLAEFSQCLPWMVLPQLALLFWRGQMRGLISYFSIPEMRRTATALGGALAFQLALRYFSHGRFAPSPSLILMDFFLSFFALCGIRMAFRMLREGFTSRTPAYHAREWRVGIIGTGELATNLALDFIRNKKTARRVIAFFDDNPRIWNKRPHDIPVVGMPECLLNSEWHEKIDEIIVALPIDQQARLLEINEMLKASPLKVTFASGWPALQTLGT